VSVVDAVRERLPGAPAAAKLPPGIPPDIEGRIRRGRQVMLKDALKRRLFRKFWEGDHYWFQNAPVA
jgi:hypothetical protein